MDILKFKGRTNPSQCHVFFSQEIAGFSERCLISSWFGLLIGWIYPAPKPGCQSATRMMKSFLLGQVRESQLKLNLNLHLPLTCMHP